ncbi:CPBP family intramembrane glutamic endopeptidase [Cellulomonas fengjieae]|uniref:CPBP family intramembrane metalloprotease n=1 Tax=Cellulomonas fengjieae TaxID=2819978 RepID=A0ABS3SGE8_9CELL|nr:CPBP family intramembrane glutamic endopeptidase [Cellulomonas fengjieae]MBO3084818.1 CPBP family intramembrane metalloprotease [Cellulomonas fengjieae]MBO3103783.1 CPBP family intramembrane metalloprotease [Cellulomonas fengjieae]QVI66866.1 CPBP family intramembrane metalloprotease [Cellulomonas fengjieae]
MDTLDTLRDLDVPTLTTLVLVALVLVLVATDPLIGRRQHAALVAGMAAAPDADTRDGILRRFYRSWTRQGWLSGAVALAAVLLLPGIGLSDLGLRLPDLGAMTPDAGDHVASTVVGAVVGLALGAGILALVHRRMPLRPRQPVAAVDAMMPVTPAARRGWAGLSLSAGVTEEITYRGLVVLALAVAVPDLPHAGVVVVAALLFGFAHWYQGWLGMVLTGALGAAFTQLYLVTGSILLLMVLHVLIDLRPLLVRPAPAARAEAR